MELSRKFSASEVHKLLVGGQGKTRLTYIYDKACENLGIYDDFTTPAMQHGISNQFEGFKQVFQPIYGGEWFDTSLDVHGVEGLSASPDVIGADFTCDMKCPYSIGKFFEQRDKLPKAYYVQSICQQMALNVKQGFVSLYLTKPQKWGEEGDWVEYPFSIKERSFTHIIEYDEETAYNITTAVETAVPILKSCIELLGGAEIVDDEYYFRNQYLGARFVELKDLTWSNYDSCLRHNDKFYIKKM